MPLSIDDDILPLALAILRGINSNIKVNDIHNTRLVFTRNTNATTQPSETSSASFPSIIVRLNSVDLTKKTMLLKKTFNYFSTKDIDTTLLSVSFVSRIPTSKIIINSVLTPAEYKNFSSLKNLAKQLGFKYIWHKDGKFLIKRKNGDRPHYITSETDIRAISTYYTEGNKKETEKQKSDNIAESNQDNTKNQNTTHK